MDKAKQAADTRRALLEAARRVIISNGVNALTLDAVAKEAGVSKGGLLYHFPSKDALVVGLLEELNQSFVDGIEQALAQDEQPQRAGRWLRAYVRSSGAIDQTELDLTAGLLAAIGTNPALLDDMRQSFIEWQTRVEQDGIDPALATIIRLAVDGLWMAEMFGLAAPTGPQREAVITRLLELTEGKGL